MRLNQNYKYFYHRFVLRIHTLYLLCGVWVEEGQHELDLYKIQDY